MIPSVLSNCYQSSLSREAALPKYGHCAVNAGFVLSITKRSLQQQDQPFSLVQHLHLPQYYTVKGHTRYDQIASNSTLRPLCPEGNRNELNFSGQCYPFDHLLECQDSVESGSCSFLASLVAVIYLPKYDNERDFDLLDSSPYRFGSNPTPGSGYWLKLMEI